LDDAEALSAGTVKIRGSEPVECQKATEVPKTYYSQYKKVFKIFWETYNLIRNIMPNASLPVHAPLRIASNIPSEQRVTRTTFSRDPSQLELSEMRLEEAKLVFSVNAGSIGHIMHDAEMIPYCSPG
jgi:hypothetical protein